MKKWLTLLLAIVLLAGCTSSTLDGDFPPPAPGTTGVVADVSGSDRGVTIIELGVANESNSPTAEYEDFEGQWQLLRADGTVRAGGHLYHLASLGAGQADFPLAWEGELESGGYTLLWGAPSVGSITVDFVVEVNGDQVLVQEITPQASETYPPAGGFIN